MSGSRVMLCYCSAVGESWGGGDVSGDRGSSAGARSQLSDQSSAVVVDSHRRRSPPLRLPLVAEYISKYSGRSRADCHLAYVSLPLAQSGVARHADRCAYTMRLSR